RSGRNRRRPAGLGRCGMHHRGAAARRGSLAESGGADAGALSARVHRRRRTRAGPSRRRVHAAATAVGDGRPSLLPPVSPYPGGMTETSPARPANTGVRQTRPKTEGWTQKKDAEGRPLLQFASPKRGKPPVHLADMTPAERVDKVKELGLPGFRAKQLSTHYFTHYTSDPAHMTDLPAAQREELVAG